MHHYQHHLVLKGEKEEVLNKIQTFGETLGAEAQNA
jgi:hypothetical protein